MNRPPEKTIIPGQRKNERLISEIIEIFGILTGDS
jgi:hypothetical protein